LDKANKCVRIINKDVYVLEMISMCLEKLEIPFTKKIDNRQRVIIEIKSLEEFNQKVGFWIKRKQKMLEELLNGNRMRERDIKYLEKFRKELIKGTTSKDLSNIFGIPHSTVKLVLRNLYSAGVIKRNKIGRSYIYYIP